jgi:hypothetical protein
MALRWTAAGMLEAAKGFRTQAQLPVLRAALEAHHAKHVVTKPVETNAEPA